MMTRQATVKNIELKLQQALLDIKAYKELNDQLLQEREESEEEVQKIIAKNTELKAELVKVHIQYTELVEKYTRAQDLVASFKECSDTHEQALNRINDLEISLCDAQKTVSVLENKKELITNQSQSLFHELLDCNLEGNNSHDRNSIINIDSSLNNTIAKTRFNSHNKLKKYIKINKYIRKTQKLLKTHRLAQKYTCQKTKNNPINKLKSVETRLDQNIIHDKYTEKIEQRLDQLQLSLKDMYEKFCQTAEKQLLYQKRAANDVVDMCCYNIDRFESINERHRCSCMTQPIIDNNIENRKDNLTESKTKSFNLNVDLGTNELFLKLDKNSNLLTENKQPKTLLFCDKIGKGFGTILHNHLLGSITNNCVPGATLEQLINSACDNIIDENTNLILYIGNSIGIKTKDLHISFQKLCKLKCKKITWCTFPYSLNEAQNRNIYKLNSTLHHLINGNSNESGNMFQLFDANLFLKHFRTELNNLYLPKRFRHIIATLLSNNINKYYAISQLTHKNMQSNENKDLHSFHMI